MSTLTVTCFITLDNVVDEPHLWSMDFQSEDTGAYNDAVLQPADAMLLGRTTYEGFAAAWPQRSGDPYTDKFNAMPKHVVSTTLAEADLSWNNSRLVAGAKDGDAALADAIRALKAEQDLLVWGSAGLVQFLVRHELVDAFELLCSPITLGTGTRLFPADGRHDFRVERATQLSGGMLALRLTTAAKA